MANVMHKARPLGEPAWEDAFWRDLYEHCKKIKYCSLSDIEQARIAHAYFDSEPAWKEKMLVSGLVKTLSTLSWLKRRAGFLALPEEAKTQRAADHKAYWEEVSRVAAIDDAKIAAFDKIVELLDHLPVGEKLLGDCTKPDLLRAAAALEAGIAECSVRAALYRQLSKMIGRGTVREAANRGEIVALLTATYREDAQLAELVGSHTEEFTQ